MCYARRQRSSWARIKLSKKFYISTRRCQYLFQSFSDFLNTFTFAWFVFLLEFSRSLTRYIFCIVLCVSSLVLLFNFQWPTPCSLHSLTIIPQPKPFVNTFLKIFFKNFFAQAIALARINARSCAALLVYHFPPRLSIGFFKVFWSFFHFFSEIVFILTSYNDIIICGASFVCSLYNNMKKTERMT